MNVDLMSYIAFEEGFASVLVQLATKLALKATVVNLKCDGIKSGNRWLR